MRRARCAIYIRQARRVLQSLDDDTLKDIGLTRFDAWRASNRALLFKLVRHRVDWSASNRCSLSSTRGVGYKGVLAARLKHHVCPPPRLIVDQAPFVALADMVDGDQHVSGTQHESLTVGSREFECP